MNRGSNLADYHLFSSQKNGNSLSVKTHVLLNCLFNKKYIEYSTINERNQDFILFYFMIIKSNLVYLEINILQVISI